MGEKMQNCFELTSLNHIVQCELRRKLLASWFCAVWEVFCVYSKWALENTIAFDLKINLHVVHTNLQMESCCVLLNSINGEYPLKKTTDFVSWDLNETWNATVHETILNHVAAKTLQLTPSELERNANTIQDRGKERNLTCQVIWFYFDVFFSWENTANLFTQSLSSESFNPVISIVTGLSFRVSFHGQNLAKSKYRSYIS